MASSDYIRVLTVLNGYKSIITKYCDSLIKVIDNDSHLILEDGEMKMVKPHYTLHSLSHNPTKALDIFSIIYTLAKRKADNNRFERKEFFFESSKSMIRNVLSHDPESIKYAEEVVHDIMNTVNDDSLFSPYTSY